MADIDIDPFGGMEHPTSGEHDSTKSRPDENIPLSPVPPVTPVGGSTWKPTHEQETSFGGGSHRTKLVKDHVRDL